VVQSLRLWVLLLLSSCREAAEATAMFIQSYFSSVQLVYNVVFGDDEIVPTFGVGEVWCGMEKT
jgi:hypothetical protein